MNLNYEVALQRVAEMERTARKGGELQRFRAEARARRRAASAAAKEIATPAIPDYAEEMFAAAGAAVPEPRVGERTARAHGRHAHAGR